MKEAQPLTHTPGPWKAIEWACHAPTTVVSYFRVARIVVAECSGQGRHTNESIADACLIAAAPDLLDGCRHAYTDFNALLACLFEGQLSPAIREQLKKTADQCEAAVKKAQGQQ
jgi:hypothetical protein